MKISYRERHESHSELFEGTLYPRGRRLVQPYKSRTGSLDKSLDLGRTFIQSDFPAGESGTFKEVESLLLFSPFPTFHC